MNIERVEYNGPKYKNIEMKNLKNNTRIINAGFDLKTSFRKMEKK